MSPGGKSSPCVGLTMLATSCTGCLEILRASTSWNPKGLSRPVKGEFLLIFKTDCVKNNEFYCQFWAFLHVPHSYNWYLNAHFIQINLLLTSQSLRALTDCKCVSLSMHTLGKISVGFSNIWVVSVKCSSAFFGRWQLCAVLSRQTSQSRAEEWSFN